ncbi:MAG: HEAT repeat domain-containing protein, partial [Candidatus Limiplasma sp.]|nr:HEAT repeat domain-containing protein [Candidatus Limiplasma sp.]
PLPAEEIKKKLHWRYLRTTKGADLLCRFITEKCANSCCAAMEEVLRTSDYPAWMQRNLHSRDMMLRILIVRLAGLMRIRTFETQIIPLMQAHQDNLNLQYAGFLALSMMGNRESILRLCSDPGFTKALSYRSLKEIFAVYTGDKRFLYEKLLDSSDGYIRRIVIKNIGEEGLTEFADRLTPLLQNDDRNLLCDVIRTLGQLRYAPAGEQIAQSLQSGDWVLRNAAVVALASIDADGYRPCLMAGLQDKEWWVRYNSARELCAHVPLQALEALLPTLQDRFATDILRFTIQETRLMGKGVAQV